MFKKDSSQWCPWYTNMYDNYFLIKTLVLKKVFKHYHSATLKIPLQKVRKLCKFAFSFIPQVLPYNFVDTNVTNTWTDDRSSC